MRPELSAGSTIGGRYAVGDVLGRGGMGEVRAGRDLRLGREVAIKLLSPEVGARPKARERFEAEARSAARLNHPNIVLVYDSGEHEGVPFLIMERLPGRTLADELADGPLPVSRVRQVGADVLAALGAAHGAGVVHRDVKPGNVLLCPDGTAKVGDFGIAKAVDDVDLTTTGLLLGTPAYLSPEQLSGEPATPASDIYSVGVLLYEALTGTKPFDAASPLALAHVVQTRSPTPVAELRPDAPPELVAAISRAMEKDPRRRFASADDMAAALTGVVPSTRAAQPMTQRFPATRRFGSRTQQAAGTADRSVGTGWLRSWTEGQRRQILVLAGIFAAVLLLAAVFGGRGEAPDRGPAIAPTTTSVGPASVSPELDRALRHLEEVVRP